MFAPFSRHPLTTLTVDSTVVVTLWFAVNKKCGGDTVVLNPLSDRLCVGVFVVLVSLQNSKGGAGLSVRACRQARVYFVCDEV